MNILSPEIRVHGHAENSCPTVSVCLPVYNGEDYLLHAIHSVLHQTFDDLELIISDNASTDRTGEISREATTPGTLAYAISGLTPTGD